VNRIETENRPLSELKLRQKVQAMGGNPKDSVRAFDKKEQKQAIYKFCTTK